MYTKNAALLAIFINSLLLFSQYRFNINQGGHWVYENNDRHYQINNHYYKGWLYYNYHTYYIDDHYHVVKGFKRIDKQIYFFNEQGHRMSGKQLIGIGIYQFTANGSLLNGWYANKYYNEYGFYVIGPQTIDHKKYFFDSNGYLASSWQNVNDQLYYYLNGIMCTDEVFINNEHYFFQQDGTLRQGWYNIDNQTYYYNDFGYFVSGIVHIDKYVYHFNEVGVLQNNTSINYPYFSDINNLVMLALEYIDVPYKYGGMSMQGVDCSGLIKLIYQRSNIDLPRTTYDLAKVGTSVLISDIMSGDIILWNDYSHASLYLGEGKVIHASNPIYGVRIDSVSALLNDSNQRISDIRRI